MNELKSMLTSDVEEVLRRSGVSNIHSGLIANLYLLIGSTEFTQMCLDLVSTERIYQESEAESLRYRIAQTKDAENALRASQSNQEGK